MIFASIIYSSFFGIVVLYHKIVDLSTFFTKIMSRRYSDLFRCAERYFDRVVFTVAVVFYGNAIAAVILVDNIHNVVDR